MGIDFQLHRASVDIAKGFRQFQKADSELSNDNIDSAVRHLNKGLDCFATAQEHVDKAEDDAYNKAGKEIDEGNKELQKSIASYTEGNADRAISQYASAMDSYDRALELID